ARRALVEAGRGVAAAWQPRGAALRSTPLQAALASMAGKLRYPPPYQGERKIMLPLQLPAFAIFAVEEAVGIIDVGDAAGGAVVVDRLFGAQRDDTEQHRLVELGGDVGEG